MEHLAWLFSTVIDVFKTPFTLYGFTFSFWQIFVWSIVAGIALYLIWRFFDE